MDTDWALKESERVAERDFEDFLVGVTLKIESNLVGYVLLNKIYALHVTNIRNVSIKQAHKAR